MADYFDPVFQQAGFPFEKNYDYRPWLKFFNAHWVYSVYASIIYVVTIFGLQRYMRDRAKLDLRRPLVLWSMALAIFSTICAFRLWQGLFLYQKLYGWKATMCDTERRSPVTYFWCFIFILSKLPELGDTLFIVLRKQKLIFLHWYHHITVFIFCWYSAATGDATGRYFVLVNCTVHAIMYTYYALRASRLVRIPRFVNVSITLIQMSQMVVGCVVNYLAYHYRSNGEHCATTDLDLQLALLIYTSYFLLFAHYFYQAYFAGSPAKLPPKSALAKESNGFRSSNGAEDDAHRMNTFKID